MQLNYYWRQDYLSLGATGDLFRMFNDGVLYSVLFTAALTITREYVVIPKGQDHCFRIPMRGFPSLLFLKNLSEFDVSIKFCDAVNENGTSLVAKAACLINDMEGNVLFVRTLPDCDKPDDADRPVVECNVEIEVLFENEVAKAFFPNGTKGGHRGGRRGHSSEESSDEDLSKESDEDSDVTVIIEALVNNPEGAEEAAEPRRGSSDGKKKGNKRGGRRGDSSEESSEEKSDEDDFDVAEGDDDEVAPEAIVAGQKGGKGRKPSKRRH
ncbi:hypothetical protein CAPTEDRAFT_210662 [Capitella teleta]|uniref:Uncharacterized protein n=1 Tax=Capitella teleta TaxID=283909 RepID=R7U389_CAPTE|nr:hypothetical protein CAPTEDRAFT_210662 [Capitella teleta]|eukprot:ELU00810.1 hypothetical protein CAPTEDRAFT_210662 [Capitella teleta]